MKVLRLENVWCIERHKEGRYFVEWGAEEHEVGVWSY